MLTQIMSTLRKRRRSSQIKAAAAKYSLDPQLVASIIWQESRGEPWAVRYEDGFYRRYVEFSTRSQALGYVPSDTLCSWASERRMRACSFGLMQLMGQPAREQGCKEPQLTRLLIPAVNLEWGCRFFRWCLNQKGGDVPAALLRYNGGANPTYDDTVLGHLNSGVFREVLP